MTCPWPASRMRRASSLSGRCGPVATRFSLGWKATSCWMRRRFSLAAGNRVRVAPRLARAALVMGRVLDQDGSPLSAVPVSVVGLVGGQDEVSFCPAPCPRRPKPPSCRRARWRVRGAFVRRFPMHRDASRSGDWLRDVRGLRFHRLTNCPLRREPLLLAPGDARDLGDLVVSTGVVLSGRVLDQDGQVLEGAQVEARAAGKPAGPANPGHIRPARPVLHSSACGRICPGRSGQGPCAAGHPRRARRGASGSVGIPAGTPGS